MILALLLAAFGVPTLEQHLASESAGFTAEPGNDYRYRLPEQVGAGNCLIVYVSYNKNPGSSTIAVSSITDSSGDTWSSTPDKIVGSGGTGTKSAVFVHPNASAGWHTITVTFNSPANQFQVTISEWSNIATSSPVNGTAGGTATSPNLSIALTPTDVNDSNGGNLVLVYWSDLNVADVASPPTDMTAGGEFTLQDASIGTFLQPHGSMSWVQSIYGDITAPVTLTGGSADTYNMLAIALKASSAGAHYDPDKMRIRKINHMTKSPTGTSWVMKFPCSVGTMIYGATSSINLTTISDTNSNTYTKYHPATNTFPQVWDTSATCSPNLKITANFSSSRNDSFIWYEVLNAKSSGNVDANGNQLPDAQTFLTDQLSGTSGTLSDFPVITVSTQGITFIAGGFGTGPQNGPASGSPTGAVNDYIYYSCETDLSFIDNADIRAHAYNVAGSVTQHWNWTMNNPATPTFPTCSGALQNSTADVSASHFAEKDAPTPPDPIFSSVKWFHMRRAR